MEYQQLLVGDDLTTGNTKGYGLALEGDILVGGALFDQLYADQGSAYVFERTDGTWSQVQKLKAPDDDADNLDHYGRLIDLDSGQLVVGAPRYSVTVSGKGSPGAAFVYQFGESGFSHTATLTEPADASTEHQLGFTVAVHGGQLAVSADVGEVSGTNHTNLVGFTGVDGLDGHGTVFTYGGSICDSVNDVCLCKPGWTGDDCGTATD